MVMVGGKWRYMKTKGKSAADDIRPLSPDVYLIFTYSLFSFTVIYAPTFSGILKRTQVAVAIAIASPQCCFFSLI